MIRLSDLRPDLQIVHNAEPVEVLWFECKNLAGELWMVHPLFVDLPDRPEVFRAIDSISYLHTEDACRTDKLQNRFVAIAELNRHRAA